ncbi:MAG: alanine racemase [Alphaproteobacteria bacterium]|nr:alanine racemase [Alphaproteobacteria bacterium]
MSGEITIDLSALARNYKTLDSLSVSTCETACSIKANAYGLGVKQCASALYKAGARSFFVATIEEGLALRKDLPEDTSIYTLNGLSPDNGDIDLYRNHNIIPVLGSLDEIAQLSESKTIPVALHFDTGMNRFGLRTDDARLMCEDTSILRNLEVCLVISHFVSSEEVDNLENMKQLAQFSKIAKRMKQLCPKARFSLSDSGGLFLGKDYHFDLVRLGVSLYGGHPSDSMKDNPMEPCISLNAPVLQIKQAYKGEGTGYNATYHFEEDTHLAIISVGYADGLMRTLSNSGSFYWKGYALPIRGRISMDLVVCDLVNVPENEYPVRGDKLEIIGPHQSIDDLAKATGTISYEILTSLGGRYKRVYKEK